MFLVDLVPPVDLGSPLLFLALLDDLALTGDEENGACEVGAVETGAWELGDADTGACELGANVVGEWVLGA